MKSKFNISRYRLQKGFTIVELLIVIVIIGILAGIVTVAYNGIQQRAKSSKTEADISNVRKLIEVYNATNGNYPVTAASLFIDWSTATARTDINCGGGTKQADWVPGMTTALPQSDPSSKGAQGAGSCYIYASDGTNYVLSAWNVGGSPQTSFMYRRLGFRESYQGKQFYLCNFGSIGGGSYNSVNDYYKYSYTVSNVSGCDETPPAGA